MLDIHSCPDSVTAARWSAKALSDLVKKYRDLPLLFLVSGGSPLEILKYLSSDGFDARVTVGVSDERFSADPAINNFAQVRASGWYKAVIGAGSESINTLPQSHETVEDCGHRFNGILRDWSLHHPDGKIVITQGIGLDGHSAGMMPALRRPEPQATPGGPYPDDVKNFYTVFDDPRVWAVGYDAGTKNKYPLRVTTTLPFLRRVDDSVIFVCGTDKKVPLGAVLARDGEVHETPARIIHEMKHCLLYTDQPVGTLK